MGIHPPSTYLKLSEKYGPIISVNLGGQNWIVLNDYDSVHEFLVKHGDVFSGRPKLHVFNEITKGYGIIFRDSDDNFKEQRKFALTTLRGFGVGKRSMEDKITEEIGYFSELIESENGESFNCQRVLATSISNVICSIVMGSRFSYDDKIFQNMISKLNDGISNKREAILVALVTFAPNLRFFPPFSGAYQRLMDDVDYVIGIFKNIIDEHKRTFDAENLRDFIDAYLKELYKRKDDKDHLFKEIQLLQTIRDFFIAGTETSSNTLRWCVLCFAHFPETQRKLANEIKKVIGDGVPSMKHKDDMPYTSAFIHEITRHKTLAPLAAPHLTTNDVTIRGFEIPKGTPVLPNLYAANHDKKYFENANEFMPERFINEVGNFVPDKHVIPFSVGPRFCLGEQLAKMELFLFLTNIIQRFEIVPDAKKTLPSFDSGVTGFAYVPHLFEVSFKARK